MSTVGEKIRKRSAAFLKKELLGDQLDETPLKKIYKICEGKQTRGYKYIRNLMMPSEIQPAQPSLFQIFAIERGTKAATYRRINPDLKIHPVYLSKEYVDERARMTFTKLRLSSHSLKVETGRWSRIAPEDRLCGCGGAVEDEEHVLLLCPKTEFARQRFHVDSDMYGNIGEVMNSLDVKVLVPFVDCCMQAFS